jgi:PAS domain S-box-containing protein
MSLIVVIDDRVTNRNILAKLASSLGNDVTVRAFDDAASALDWTTENTPDLIITDFKMPRLDGAEFIRAIRQRPQCFDVPVIVVTVYEDREFRYKALEAGASDFLISPVDHHEFRVRVQNLLTMRRQQEIIRRRALTLEEVLNLTNRLRTEEQRQSKEVLGLVIDAVPAMICVSDAQGQVAFVNSYQCEFFGIDAEQAVGKRVAELFGEEYGRRHQEFSAQVIESGQAKTGLEEHLVDREGRERLFLTTKAPLNDGRGRIATVVSVSLDISDRKVAERELREAKERADAANEHQPRAAHAFKRHHRLCRDDEDRAAGPDRQSALSRIFERHPCQCPASAPDHRRHARRVPDRGRQAGADRGPGRFEEAVPRRQPAHGGARRRGANRAKNRHFRQAAPAGGR